MRNKYILIIILNKCNMLTNTHSTIDPNKKLKITVSSSTSQLIQVFSIKFHPTLNFLTNKNK